MSLFNIFRAEKIKRKLEELEKTLLLNPEYFKEVKALKLKRDLSHTFI
jgi:hypothetical protein